MKFHVFIDNILLRKPDGSEEITKRDISKFDLRAAEAMIIEDDMAMIKKSNIKASIHLARETRHFRELSNRNIRVERVEEANDKA